MSPAEREAKSINTELVDFFERELKECGLKETRAEKQPLFASFVRILSLAYPTPDPSLSVRRFSHHFATSANGIAISGIVCGTFRSELPRSRDRCFRGRGGEYIYRGRRGFSCAGSCEPAPKNCRCLHHFPAFLSLAYLTLTHSFIVSGNEWKLTWADSRTVAICLSFPHFVTLLPHSAQSLCFRAISRPRPVYCPDSSSWLLLCGRGKQESALEKSHWIIRYEMHKSRASSHARYSIGLIHKLRSLQDE